MKDILPVLHKIESATATIQPGHVVEVFPD